jgi:hypothetical protein
MGLEFLFYPNTFYLFEIVFFLAVFVAGVLEQKLLFMLLRLIVLLRLLKFVLALNEFPKIFLF